MLFLRRSKPRCCLAQNKKTSVPLAFSVAVRCAKFDAAVDKELSTTVKYNGPKARLGEVAQASSVETARRSDNTGSRGELLRGLIRMLKGWKMG